MRLAIALVLLASPGASALAALDDGPLRYEGLGTDTARFQIRLRVEGERSVEVQARLPEGWRGEVAIGPAGAVERADPKPLPATWRLDPASPDARWRGYTGVFALDLAVAAPNLDGRREGALLVAPSEGVGIAVPLTLDLVGQRLETVVEPSPEGANLRVRVEGGKRAVSAEAVAEETAHPLPRVAPAAFAGSVPSGDVVVVVTFWDGARLTSDPLRVPGRPPAPADLPRAPTPVAPAEAPPSGPRAAPVPEPVRPPPETGTETPGPAFGLLLAGLLVAARFAR